MAETRKVRMQVDFRKRKGMTPFLSVLILLVPAIPHLLGLTSGNTSSTEAVEVQ